ncbi:MAG: mandelate racemase/muconate lactonizing enzyme family protein [Acetobacteraceae bacterium]|nr:mandelate racemase/muconate lactonizing enzyme family protein [Acetobacteraceae bacterium]
MSEIRIAAVEAYAFRVPIAEPIKVAFGTFRDRPAVYVRLIDEDGTEGWGEAWCNWPAVGAEHRARLAADLGERLIGQTFAEPGDVFRTLERDLEVLVLQTGEIGPIAQALAGIDIAVWDLAARKRELPLYRMLGAGPVETVPVYVTGINPDAPEHFAVAKQAEGHRAFKLKIGFGPDLDRRNIEALRATLDRAAILAVDANQALTLEPALSLCREVAGFGLHWLEEPLRVDAPKADWQRLAASAPMRLAGGENLRGPELDAAAADPILQVIQPDMTKWGGFTGNLPIGRGAVARGKSFCPHVFGAGIALIASLHLLAAAGGDGLLEFDCHPNAARELVVGALLPVREGRVPVPQSPGLGTTPDLGRLRHYQTWPVLGSGPFTRLDAV